MTHINCKALYIFFFSVCVLSVRMSGVIIKQLLTYLLTYFIKESRRDRAGPRISDDSNSQNVNSRLFSVKRVFQSVSQSVTDHRDYYVNKI